MIKERLEKYRAMELEIMGVDTRRRMLMNNLCELREEVLDLSMNEDEGGVQRPCLNRFSFPLDGAVAVVSINVEYYEFPRGHEQRVEIEFIPIGMGA